MTTHPHGTRSFTGAAQIMAARPAVRRAMGAGSLLRVRSRSWLVVLVMLVVTIALGSSVTRLEVGGADERPIDNVVLTVGTAAPSIAHELATGPGSAVLDAAGAEHVVPCLERVDCAGGFAGALLMAALVVAAVVATATPASLPCAAPVRVEHRPGRLVGGGVFRPPRTGS